jgi:hypothetical protein
VGFHAGHARLPDVRAAPRRARVTSCEFVPHGRRQGVQTFADGGQFASRGGEAEASALTLECGSLLPL